MIDKRFTRISWNEKAVALEWTTQDGAESRNIAMTSVEEPHLDFRTALQALRDDVLTIAELQDFYGGSMRIQSVSLSVNSKSGVRGAVITAMKTLDIANGPMALHTPHLNAESASDEESNGSKGKAKSDEKKGLMPMGMLTRIETLETEAWAYLAGKRAPKSQTELPLEGAKEADEEEELEGAGV